MNSFGVKAPVTVHKFIFQKLGNKDQFSNRVSLCEVCRNVRQFLACSPIILQKLPDFYGKKHSSDL